MELTDNQALPFPEGQDFGNGALDLQFLAQTIDARMKAQELALNDVLFPPCKVLGLTAVVPISSGGTAGITWNKTIYNQGFLSTTNIRPRDSGTYMMGVYLSAIPTGTVTANAAHNLNLTVTVPTGPNIASDQRTFTSVASNIEPGAGGSSDLTTQMIFSVETVPGNLASIVNTTFFHTNVGSTMNVQTTSYIWIIKISELG